MSKQARDFKTFKRRNKDHDDLMPVFKTILRRPKKERRNYVLLFRPLKKEDYERIAEIQKVGWKVWLKQQLDKYPKEEETA